MLHTFQTLEGRRHFAIGLVDKLTSKKLWYVYDYAEPFRRGKWETDKDHQQAVARYIKAAYRDYKELNNYNVYVQEGNELVKVEWQH